MCQFTHFLHEVFHDFGSIHFRKMFGGHGLYHAGVMIALVADDTLYLKADKATAVHFIERGLSAFEYNRAGKQVKMSYFLAPEDIYDAPEEARYWANMAYEAALRSKTKT